MTTKKEEDLVYHVYPTTDFEGGVRLPDDLSKLCLMIDDYSQVEAMTERSEGMFAVILEVLSTPVTALHSRLKEFLEDIIEEEDIIAAPFDADVKDDEKEELNNYQAKKEEKPMQAPEKEQEDDISDAELEAEFASKPANKNYNDVWANAQYCDYE